MLPHDIFILGILILFTGIAYLQRKVAKESVQRNEVGKEV